SLDLDGGSLKAKLSYSGEPAPKGGSQIDAAVHHLELAEKGVVLFGWDALRVLVSRSDPAEQVYVVDQAWIEGIKGEVVKLPGGTSRTFGLTRRPVSGQAPKKVEPAPAAAHASEPAPLPTVELKKKALSLSAALIAVRDRSHPEAGEPAPYV